MSSLTQKIQSFNQSVKPSENTYTEINESVIDNNETIFQDHDDTIFCK
eukprot:UN16931